MKVKKTNRGFARIEFADRNKVSCSLQKSSLAGDDCVWFGCNDAEPKVLEFKINGGIPNGWVPLPLPYGIAITDVSFNTRMHLTRAQVKKLLPHLQKFVEMGEI